MIDNFEVIRPYLKFEGEHDFYFLQIIQRKKDFEADHKLGINNNNRLIKAYYIYSIEQLERYKEEIVSLCTMFNARACIGLNKRNSKDLSLEMLALLATNIKNSHFNQLSKLYNTVCGQYHSDKDKSWIVDMDKQSNQTDEEFMNMVNYVAHKITTIEPCKPIIGYIPSKNGLHIITHPFNTKVFSERYPDIEVHKNNPVNLYVL